MADAGDDQETYVGNLVVLDGTGSSDPDGDELTYSWAIVEESEAGGLTLTLEDTATPVLTARSKGIYTLALTVDDGEVSSSPDMVTITVVNTPPVAEAGEDQSAVIGARIELNGMGSGDADGDALTYSWTVVSAETEGGVALSDETSATPSVDVLARGTYVLQLIVNDGELDSEPDTVQVIAINEPPVADAGADAEAELDTMVMLDGSGSSDPEGAALTYEWRFIEMPEGSDAAFDDPVAQSPAFVPAHVGTYVVQLVVDDGVLASAPDTVSIVVLKTPDDVLVDCDTLPRQTLQVPLNFASTVLGEDEDNYPGRCQWDHDTVDGESAQGMDHDFIQGFHRQSVQPVLPDNAVVCSSTISANSGNDVYWRYDDEFFLTVGDTVIVSSEKAWRMQPLVPEDSELEYGQGPYSFDFDAIKWQEYYHSPERYCLGHPRIGGDFAEGDNPSCRFPKTQTWGEFNIDIAAEAFAEVSADIVNDGAVEFSLVVTGDDDPAIDCQHSGIELNWDVEYVIPQ